ncbi:MAG: DUF2723 domain-containing protein [Kiritimatiellia bacterium]
MNPRPATASAHDARWIAAALLCVAAVYAATLSPAPGPSGDNAEFQFLGRVLGLSHPTGYPLYLLVTHAFQWALPFGTLAWRINLFSLLCALAALGALAAIGRRLDLPGWCLFIALGWLAATDAWWRLGTVAEVYAPHAALSFLTLWLFLRWRDSRERGWLAAGILAHGLSYGNHLTTLLLLPVLVLLVWRTDRRQFACGRTLAWAVVAILAGASLYAYVLLRGRMAPDPDVYARIRTAGEFLGYVTGSQYRGVMGPAGGAEGACARSLWVAALLGREFSVAALPALAGLALLVRRERTAGAALCLGAALQVLVIWQYRIADIQDYLLPLGGFLALGLAAAMAEAARGLSRHGRPVRGAVAVAAAVLAAVALRHAPGRYQYIRAVRGGPDPAALRALATSTTGPAVLLCPHWQQANIAKYHTRGEGLGGGFLDVRIWTPADTAGSDLPSLRGSLAELLAQHDRVVVYSREGDPQYDLAAVFRRAGARFEPLDTHLLVLTSVPPP